MSLPAVEMDLCAVGTAERRDGRRVAEAALEMGCPEHPGAAARRLAVRLWLPPTALERRHHPLRQRCLDEKRPCIRATHVRNHANVGGAL